jgi:hypothetical protein
MARKPAENVGGAARGAGDRSTHRLELSVVLLRQLIDQRRDHAARTAPGRPEVDKNRDIALEHLSLKGGVGHDGCSA